MKTCPKCHIEIPSFLAACGKLGCIIAAVSQTPDLASLSCCTFPHPLSEECLDCASAA